MLDRSILMSKRDVLEGILVEPFQEFHSFERVRVDRCG